MRPVTRSLVALLLLACGTQTVPQKAVIDSRQWEPEIAAYEATDRTNPPNPGGVLFVGSSSIRLWQTLQSDFPGVPVLNRGFGGSEIGRAHV